MSADDLTGTWESLGKVALPHDWQVGVGCWPRASQ
jgi:hypothetical protein